MPNFQGLTLPGIGHLAATYASMPVWSGSLKNTVQLKWEKMTRAERTIRYARAEQWDAMTKVSGSRRHGGVIGRTALRVYHAMLFTFYNFNSGRLDPSYDTLASKTGLARSAVWRALKRLRALGLINWVRRCSETYQDGRFLLKQESNAYAIAAEVSWKGYMPAPARPRTPDAGTWGEHPPMLDALSQHAADRAMGISHEAATSALAKRRVEFEARSIEAAFARLGGHLLEREAAKHQS